MKIISFSILPFVVSSILFTGCGVENNDKEERNNQVNLEVSYDAVAHDADKEKINIVDEEMDSTQEQVDQIEVNQIAQEEAYQLEEERLAQEEADKLEAEKAEEEKINQAHSDCDLGVEYSGFITKEYCKNGGLGIMFTSSAYEAGATGRGIVVAVIDSGIESTHPEFEGKISEKSIF